MKQQYSKPKLEQYNFVFERGFDLSTNIGGWESGGESSGDAE
jgi:hypothetical protein